MTISLSTVLTIVLFGASLAFANPATLPKHPGYPMGKAVDPVTGQSLANDPGQRNAVGDKALSEAAAADTAHVTQNLSINQNDKRILEKPGAGLLPRVEGPNIVIAPQVKEATTMPPPPK
jgi:hypothetical protein